MSIKIEIVVSEWGGLDEPKRKIKVLSHWNWGKCVVLEIGKEKYTFDGYDLINAIKKAQRD